MTLSVRCSYPANVKKNATLNGEAGGVKMVTHDGLKSWSALSTKRKCLLSLLLAR